MRTNKDAPSRRPYRLSPAGLAALRASAFRNRPWCSSTGPTAAAGKARASRNATRHGERSMRTAAAQRELRAALRAVDADESRKARQLDDTVDVRRFDPVWVERIVDELWMSLLSRELLLARLTSNR